MAYWLFKSEPDTWGWDDQVAKGDAGEEWDGVRNYQARNNMRAMKVGDLGFFYHSNIGKEIVGIVEVSAAKRARQHDRRSALGLRAYQRGASRLITPVTLEDCKVQPGLENMALVKTTRLSVQPVTADEWRIVCAMGGVQP